MAPDQGYFGTLLGCWATAVAGWTGGGAVTG